NVWDFETLGEGEVIVDLRTGDMTATNASRITYGPTVLVADWMKANRNTGDAVAEGHVILQREGQLWRGERLTYNFHTREITGKEFRTGQRPFFVEGRGLYTEPETNRYVMTNAYFTTDDHA